MLGRTTSLQATMSEYSDGHCSCGRQFRISADKKIPNSPMMAEIPLNFCAAGVKWIVCPHVIGITVLFNTRWRWLVYRSPLLTVCVVLDKVIRHHPPLGKSPIRQETVKIFCILIDVAVYNLANKITAFSRNVIGGSVWNTGVKLHVSPRLRRKKCGILNQPNAQSIHLSTSTCFFLVPEDVEHTEPSNTNHSITTGSIFSRDEATFRCF